jgi:T4 bacteriophage base plate protein
MPLPKIATPTYELELPSTGKTIKYRPFLVKEEKVLILALETQDTKQITLAIKQVLKDCILTKGIKVDELPSFDIEYIFLNVRGKSVGEAIDLIVTCSDDGETEVPVKIYVDEIQVQKNPEHSTEIRIDDEIVIKMKYPSLDQFIKNNFDFTAQESVSTIERSFEIISSCVEAIFTAEESWAASDCTKKELIEFIESMNAEQFKKIEGFFETMPKLTHTFVVTNPKTKVENTVTLEGLTSFFG